MLGGKIIIKMNNLNTQDKKTLTICLLTFNSADYLPYLFKSLVEQTFTDWNLLVLDNASVDNSVALVKEYYPPAKVITQKQNLGFAKGHNLLINWSDSKYVLVLNPDLVLIGGDQIMNNGSSISEYLFLYPLKNLAEKYPVYAIHGNHEYGVGRSSIDENWVWLPNLSENTKWYAESLGIKYLTNDLEKITVNEEEFYLFGGDSLLANKLDTKILEERTEDIPTIALIHHPLAIKEIVNKNIDLLLSGHTHGGQIRLPFIGPLGKIETKIPTSWYQGFSQYEDVKLFVSSGTGETGARSRFLNPPEIVLLTIK